jgi:hypothetical protein
LDFSAGYDNVAFLWTSSRFGCVNVRKEEVANGSADDVIGMIEIKKLELPR